VEMVSQTQAALLRIVRQASDLSGMIGGLAEGSGRQADAIAQVNGVIADLDKATQQNAALVEETTAAATSLANESERLAQVVGRFSLSGVVQTTPCPAGRRPRRCFPPRCRSPRCRSGLLNGLRRSRHAPCGARPPPQAAAPLWPARRKRIGRSFRSCGQIQSEQWAALRELRASVERQRSWGSGHRKPRPPMPHIRWQADDFGVTMLK
jgi:hypothetical protein